MRSTTPRVIAAALCGGLVGSASLLAATPKLQLKTDFRWRSEVTDSPSGDAAKDSSYALSHGRLRLGADLAWPAVKLHAMVQAAGSWWLPSNGAFGAGPVYFGANGESDPDSVDLSELSIAWTGKSGRLVVGRQGWEEGNEIATGVAYLDGIKKRRLGERLIGNWDWVNVGRRFDGVSFSAANASTHVAGFAFRPLGGGVSYREAFEELDDLEIYGLTVTGRYGEWLPKSDVRLFAIQYEDGRQGARTAAGGDLSISTLGASLLAGGAGGDLVLWGAWQGGDWGSVDHEAWAAFVEGGGKIGRGPNAATLRAGFAVASGDGEAGGDHRTFANLLPTNHKFYGSIDYLAFQNVQELFVELLLKPSKSSSARFAVHHFDLNQEEDAWYGGSGAYDEAALGYAARRPRGGFTKPDLGWEYDVEGRLALPRGFALDAGLSYFEAGGAGREVLRVDGSGWWGFAQLVWSHAAGPALP